MGVGGKAGYDATLSDKAISEAIGQLVENIINKCTNSPWKTYFLSCDSEATLLPVAIAKASKRVWYSIL